MPKVLLDTSLNGNLQFSFEMFGKDNGVINGRGETLIRMHGLIDRYAFHDLQNSPPFIYEYVAVLARIKSLS